MEVAQKIKNRVTYDSSIPLGIYPPKLKTLICRDTCTPAFAATLFRAAQTEATQVLFARLARRMRYIYTRGQTQQEKRQHRRSQRSAGFPLRKMSPAGKDRSRSVSFTREREKRKQQRNKLSHRPQHPGHQGAVWGRGQGVRVDVKGEPTGAV